MMSLAAAPCGMTMFGIENFTTLYFIVIFDPCLIFFDLRQVYGGPMWFTLIHSPWSSNCILASSPSKFLLRKAPDGSLLILRHLIFVVRRYRCRSARFWCYTNNTFTWSGPSGVLRCTRQRPGVPAVLGCMPSTHSRETVVSLCH
jgi:hypothetical protein